MAENPKTTRQQAKRLQVKCLRAATRGRVLLLEPASCWAAEILEGVGMTKGQRRKAKRTVRLEKRVQALMKARGTKSVSRNATRARAFHQHCCFGFSL